MFRVINVAQVVIKYSLDEYLTKHEQAQFLNSTGIFFRKLFNIVPRIESIEVRLRLALEELGPVFIKFGQIISTRRDLLPEKLADELALLKDKAPTISGFSIQTIVESELGQPINTVFSDFSLEPIAAASVAQVHRAKLITGEDVVVKVLRPDIDSIIKSDLAMFKDLIISINFFKSNLKIFNMLGMIKELETSILQELDLELEADNAEKFRYNFKDIASVKIPKVYRSISSKKILVMERMYGTPIDNVKELTSKNINLKDVAKFGVEILILQIFRDRFFHADQHSGNVWIADNGDRIFLDFGIMGTLSKEDRDIAIKLMIALFSKNYTQFVDIQIQAGWLSKDADVDAVRKSFKNINGLLVKGSIATAFYRLMSLGEKHGIKTPVQFTLLVKTLIAVEGIAKTIDPTIDLARIAPPIFIKHFSKYLKAK
jgi:ubiquinone biosynthesis protein